MKSDRAACVKMYPAFSFGSVNQPVSNRRNSRNSWNVSGHAMSPVIAMWVAYVVMVVCNVLFEALRLGGTTSAEVSASVFAWFTPAGYVFSIWGLIYVALLAWLVYYTREESRNAADVTNFTPKTAGLFIASCILNVAWLVLFHFQQTIVALVVIAALWGVLVALYRDIHARYLSSTWAKVLGWVPISIYVGWISVAVLANASHVITRLAGGSLAPFVGELSTLIVVAVVLAAGFLMRKRYDDIAIPLVFLWAIIGVGVNLINVSISTSIIIFALSVIAAFLTFFKVGEIRVPSRVQ
ncbi:TspO/MBR family protein [Adlercreutzia sp. ZJ304]|uniref:TspO/MBR family protein n=1 Tax=Adlercreutzia sp. ZJ304 TaxID=2709791 RepID=UPI0013EB56D3|nr:TspO/MBR family protein [Adlercreutzia sp. ZJ304]